MQILLTNDDGIYAPGLAALERALERLGDVALVAPATEQSGVGHSITFLSPLMAKEVFEGDRHRGWAVEGSPADCVKLAIAEFCPRPPELLVSGINGGLNLGVNVLYSGTVAAATEGALNNIKSIAVSLEYDEHADFDRAADLAVDLIAQLLAQPGADDHLLYNVNIPIAALQQPKGVRVVPMATARWEAEFDRRVDPKGRRYYWAAGSAPDVSENSDVAALRDGYVTLTPLTVDRTEQSRMSVMHDWCFAMPQNRPAAATG